MSDEVHEDEIHDTRGTFLITGMILLMVVAVWVLVYASLLSR
jgi:phosphate starvation-inducible membrane PsiE